MDPRDSTRLLQLANRQFGVLHHADLVRFGLTQTVIREWLRCGRLTRLHHCVYALGHSVLRDEGRWLAAVWAGGPGAVLSHSSAAAFHGLYAEESGADVHVSTTRRATSRPGLVVHRVRYLDMRRDVFHPHPLKVTTIPRTLVDIADELEWPAYRDAADKVTHLRLDRVAATQQRAPGRRGAPLVRRFLEADDAHAKSEFERRYTRFADRHSLPGPDHRNAWLAGHKPDCIYERARLVVELDGRAYHQRRREMRKDRQRNTDYQLAGYRIVRLLWDDLHAGEAGRTAAQLRRMLALR